MRRLSFLALLWLGCGGPSGVDGGLEVPLEDAGATPDAGTTDAGIPDAGVPSDAGRPVPHDDLSRDILHTDLQLDILNLLGTANITVAPSPELGLSFEVGDLEVRSVKQGEQTLFYRVVASDAGPFPIRRLDIDVPVSSTPSTVTVAYKFHSKMAYSGWLASIQTSFLWPTYCGNLFPCHTAPEDGTTFTLDVQNVASGKAAVYPRSIDTPAPSYMLAIAVAPFNYTSLGFTDAGTEVGFFALPGDTAAGNVGTESLLKTVNWLETTLGPYAFGPMMAGVDAPWGFGAYGGMEHHPFFHVGQSSFTSAPVFAHEAAHGWFGDGVRIRCWEDFVLSEGTADYLMLRSVETTGDPMRAQMGWNEERLDLAQAVATGDTVAWPTGCNQIDLAHHPLWSRIPYTKGAFFFRHLGQQIGAERLDSILGSFYRAHRGQAASMRDLIDTIATESGFDPTPLVNQYLRSLGNPEP